jgi:hypothetical protein
MPPALPFESKLKSGSWLYGREEDETEVDTEMKEEEEEEDEGEEDDDNTPAPGKSLRDVFRVILTRKASIPVL